MISIKSSGNVNWYTTDIIKPETWLTKTEGYNASSINNWSFLQAGIGTCTSITMMLIIALSLVKLIRLYRSTVGVVEPSITNMFCRNITADRAHQLQPMDTIVVNDGYRSTTVPFSV